MPQPGPPPKKNLPATARVSPPAKISPQAAWIANKFEYFYVRRGAFLNGGTSIVIALIGLLCIPGVPCWGQVIFVALAVLQVCGFLIQMEDTSKSQATQDKFDQQTSQLAAMRGVPREFFRLLLARIFYDELKLEPGKDRISLFVHFSGAFLILGRFSYNQKKGAIGRKIFEEGQGCLGKAWENGECLVRDLPAPFEKGQAEAPENVRQEYIDRVSKEFHLSEEVIRMLTMKSRSYYGIRLDESLYSQGTAVLIVESLEEKGVNRNTFNDLSVETKTELLRHIRVFESVLPSLNDDDPTNSS